MKQTNLAPIGRIKRSPSKYRASVLPLKKYAKKPSLVQPYDARRSYRTVEEMVHKLRPAMPVTCIRPSTIISNTKWFLENFAGDVMFAVKTNPDKQVLAYLYEAGIRHFDVASIEEIKLIAENLGESTMYFMHPVKSREAIYAAYFTYGIRDFSLDCHEELTKILEVTNHASDLNLHVRLAISSDSAAYSLAGKFGIAPKLADSLVVATRKASRRFGLCFHVGSQCMEPESYGLAIKNVAGLVKRTGVHLDVLDIGGGFPSVYPGLTPPPLSIYMKNIKEALKEQKEFAHCRIMSEPGRVLVAEGGSIVVRVDLRKGNMLYINDGTYGSLFDAGMPEFAYPVKAIRPEGSLSDELMEFGFYGPTCDSIDVMKGPFYLPIDIKEGDWIEIGQLGAYGATMRTNFNGFYSDETVEVSDKPLLSIFGIN